MSTPAASSGLDPRPPFPIGWFMVARADELGPGAVLERTFLGDQVVAFRTGSGRAVVASAY